MLKDLLICLTVFAKHSISNLWEGSDMCRVLDMSAFSIFQDCQYARALNFQGHQGLPIFVNMTGFWICTGIQLRNGSEYSRIMAMPGFYICKCCTMFWICLNNAWINCSSYDSVEYAWPKFHRIFMCIWF